MEYVLAFVVLGIFAVVVLLPMILSRKELRESRAVRGYITSVILDTKENKGYTESRWISNSGSLVPPLDPEDLKGAARGKRYRLQFVTSVPLQYGVRRDFYFLEIYGPEKISTSINCFVDDEGKFLRWGD